MIKGRWLIALGLLTYVVGLLALMPARIAVEQGLSRVVAAEQPWRLTQVQGVLFDGSARLSMRNRDLGRLHWRVHPLSLFTGGVDIDLRLKAPDAVLDGRARIGFGSEITVSALVGQLPLGLVRQWFPMKGLLKTMDGLEGRVLLDIRRLRLEGRMPVEVEGELRLSDATLRLTPPASLGEFRLQLTSESEGALRGVLRDAGDGPLQVAGEIELALGRSYRVDVKLAYRESAEPRLRQLLSAIGNTSPDGTTRFAFNGRLAPQ